MVETATEFIPEEEISQILLLWVTTEVLSSHILSAPRHIDEWSALLGLLVSISFEGHTNKNSSHSSTKGAPRQCESSRLGRNGGHFYESSIGLQQACPSE